jgi:hypothetical protein
VVPKTRGLDGPHHSAAYTLDAYGHLIDNEVGVALNREELGLAAEDQHGSA